MLEFTQKNEQNTLKVYGTHIKYFTFVQPAEVTVATINDNNVLQLWDVFTGGFVSVSMSNGRKTFMIGIFQKCEMKLDGFVTNLCSNPLFGYIVVSFDSGKVELLKTDPNVEHICKIVLCDEEMSSVDFFSDGRECIVTSFPTGRFYRVNVSR